MHVRIVDREVAAPRVKCSEEAEPIGDGDAVLSMLSTLVSMRNTVNVGLANVNLEAVRGTAVQVTNPTRGSVGLARIRNTGRQGISVSGGSGILPCSS